MTDRADERVELLPCPFCGGEAGMIRGIDTKDFRIWCLKPTHKFGAVMVADSEDAVRTTWNRRAPAPARLGEEAPEELLISMAMRLNHGFGLDSPASQRSQITSMRQVYEEVAGTGFYSEDRKEFYRTALTQTAPAQIQACRAEDRAMLATPAGKELVQAAVAEMTAATRPGHPDGMAPAGDRTSVEVLDIPAFLRRPALGKMWEHGCDAVCANLTLWVNRCPHCGKPASTTAEPAGEDGPHKRVFEYDGSFKCLDCSAKWGAFPGWPTMPTVCTPTTQPSLREKWEGLNDTEVENILYELQIASANLRSCKYLESAKECDKAADMISMLHQSEWIYKARRQMLGGEAVMTDESEHGAKHIARLEKRAAALEARMSAAPLQADFQDEAAELKSIRWAVVYQLDM